jgi:HisJ family histidinol phosphate phosphatase
MLPHNTFDRNGIIQVAVNGDLHVHSTFSDGHSTPEEIVQRAIIKGYKYIGVVDHVRRTSDWLDKFSGEMARLKQLYSDKIQLYSGIEAKIINLNGDIDARPTFFPEVDIVLGAIHRIPKGQNEYFNSDEISADNDKALECWLKGMMKLIENPHVHIVAHPTAMLERYNIQIPSEIKSLISQQAAVYDKIFEVNLKYKVPDNEFIRILQLNNVKLSIGSDSHSIDEM